MNDSLKKRLTGAAVLLIVAGLLWPLVFDFDQSMRPPQLELNVAEAPVGLSPAHAVNTTLGNGSNTAGNTDSALGNRNSAPDNARNKSAAHSGASSSGTLTDRLSAEAQDLAELLKNTADAAGSVVSGQAAATSRNQPRLDAHKIPVSYVVQVATFNDWSNASKFKETLLANSFKAYIKPATSAQAGPYRIAVGPVLTYAEAESVVTRIQREHKIMDTIIRRLRDV